ncbi:ATP-binding protein [Streptomyces sp. NPDC048171]|uniref:ATP-binding protein n=1 Tax=Streptomyces sp. NPDC048171 TaxID=3365504 RepID=UPI0037190353
MSNPTLASCRPPDLEDVAQTSPKVPDCGRDVVHARFEVATLSNGLPPRSEDACQVGTMRRIAAARLRYCGLEAMTDDVMLIVSELLTNALQHSGTTEISLVITVADGALRVRVRDGMPTPAVPRRPGPAAESGRGLLLVDAVAKENGGSWGTSEAGAETWCCLPLPPQGQP